LHVGTQVNITKTATADFSAQPILFANSKLHVCWQNRKSTEFEVGHNSSTNGSGQGKRSVVVSSRIDCLRGTKSPLSVTVPCTRVVPGTVEPVYSTTWHLHFLHGHVKPNGESHDTLNYKCHQQQKFKFSLKCWS
jgi:hypothetical protein